MEEDMAKPDYSSIQYCRNKHNAKDKPPQLSHNKCIAKLKCILSYRKPSA